MPLLAQLVDDVVVNKVELNKDAVSIGRHPDSDIQIDDLAVSGRHARITVSASKYIDNMVEVTLEDLGSTNGTFVNEEQISSPRLLSHNDIVRVGWNKFKFVDELQGSLEGTAHILQP